jgi:hypothetical protein
VIAENPALTGSPISTTVTNVPAPIGPDEFTVGAYASPGGAGALLGAATDVPFTVLKAQLNTLNLTLDGNLNSIVCEPVAPFVTGTGSAFTVVGPTGQIVLLPEDAGTNVIIGPGTIPALSLAATTPSQATVTTTGTSNEFTANVLTTGTVVPLTASGTDLAGNTVSNTACSITREPALYVTNHGPDGLAPSVSIYSATATGSAVPVATLAGNKTNLSGVQFAAVDPQGNLYVTNEGPMPGATFSPTSGYVTVYGPGSDQSGNQAPIATITNLNVPEGITFDSKNNLYVLSIDRIQEFPPGLGNATGPPSNIIAGSKTDLVSCYGMFVDASGIIYTACSDVLNVFPAGSTGNATPALIETPTQTSMSFGSNSWLSVAADSSGTIYAPAFNQQQDAVDGYAAGTTGASVPTIDGQGFSQPLGIFIDASGYFYVANFGNSSVDVFDTKTALEVGAPAATATITGSGLSEPYGVYVR